MKYVDRTTDRNLLRIDTIYKELTAKDHYLEVQLTEDRKKTLERERLFAYKSDYQVAQKSIQNIETKVNEFNTEYDDQLSDFKKSILDFNKRVTDVAKNLTKITKENEDLSNAAKLATQAQELLHDCTVKLESTELEMKKIHKILDTKTGNDDFYKNLGKKIDRNEVSLQGVYMIGDEYDWFGRGKTKNQRMSC